MLGGRVLFLDLALVANGSDIGAWDSPDFEENVLLAPLAPDETAAAPDDASDNDGASLAVPAPDERIAAPELPSLDAEANAPGCEAVLALLAEPRLAPDAPALSKADANASGTAKSSEIDTAKRNNLFIMTPPKHFYSFFDTTCL